jgi:predicted DCC family thiol-disulfide oxidoreductase YuxK
MPLELPDPDSHPGADVVIYDGHCRFCRSQAERLARLDGGKRLAFLSLHDARVAARYADLTRDRLMSAMFVVTRDGKRLEGATAIRWLSRRLPRLWPLAPLLHIPGSMPLWRWLYGQLARRRYRWGRVAQDDECPDGACRLHRRLDDADK